MMKTRYIPVACAAALLLTGCFHDFHEAQPGMGYIVPEICWELPEDEGTPIEHLDIAVLGSDTAFSVEYASVQELASDLLAVPPGEYDLLVAANMTAENGYALLRLPATKADENPWRVTAARAEGDAPLGESWFSVVHAVVKAGEFTRVRPVLQRLVSPLALEIFNMPGGTELSIKQTSVADGIILTGQDESGRYGVPSSRTAASYQVLSGPDLYLFPTVAGAERCYLLLTIRTNTGQELACICDAPRVDVGKSYTLSFDYNELQPFMTITSYSISPWEEGWTVSGEVLNPKN